MMLDEEWITLTLSLTLRSPPQSSRYTGDFFAQIGRNWKIIRTWVSWRSFYPGKVLIVSLVITWLVTSSLLTRHLTHTARSLRCLRASGWWSHARDRVDVIVVASVCRVFGLERRRVPVHFMLHLLGPRVPVDEAAVGLSLGASDTVPGCWSLSPGASTWSVTWSEAGLAWVGGCGLGCDLSRVPGLATPTAQPTGGGRLVGARGDGSGDRAQTRDVGLLGVPARRAVSPSHVQAPVLRLQHNNNCQNNIWSESGNFMSQSKHLWLRLRCSNTFRLGY